MVATLVGTAVAATAQTAWGFATGQFVAGLAGGLLAVFGISSAIQHLDEGLRVRVVAASSAMWIMPALVGPPATLALEHLLSWRWTLLVPVPVVLVGRLLVARAVRGAQDEYAEDRPLWRTYGTSMARAAVVLSAAPLAWALTSLLVPRLRRMGRQPHPSVGLALTAIGVGGLSATLILSTAFGAALAAWTIAGMGVGLAYPILYLRSTTAGSFGATELAAAVITAEAFGGLLGRAVGGAVVSLDASTGMSRTGGLALTYAMFAVLLVAATLAAVRSGRTRPDQRATDVL